MSFKIMSENTLNNSDHSLLSILGKATLIIGAYLYFCGWVYIYYFIDNFSISLASIEIPFYYFIVYAYSVIFNWLSVIILIITLIILLIAYKYISNKMINLLLLILLFPVLLLLARYKANSESLSIRRGDARSIVFYFKENSANFPENFIQYNKNRKLKFITKTKDRYYVIYQPASPKGAEHAISRAHIYDIRNDDVRLVEIIIE
jgi:hypothetical protein